MSKTYLPSPAINLLVVACKADSIPVSHKQNNGAGNKSTRWQEKGTLVPCVDCFCVALLFGRLYYIEQRISLM